MGREAGLTRGVESQQKNSSMSQHEVKKTKCRCFGFSCILFSLGTVGRGRRMVKRIRRKIVHFLLPQKSQSVTPTKLFNILRMKLIAI